MIRAFPLVVPLLAVAMVMGVAQPREQTKTLGSLTQELESHPDHQLRPEWAAELDGVVNTASLEEIRQTLPAVVALTESPNPQLRGGALLLLYGIALRQKTGLPENRRQVDLSADELIVPYLPRLAARLTDSATPARGMSLLLFQTLTVLRPTPPELLNIALKVLQDPQSTQQTPDTALKSADGKAPSVGPQALWILLLAGATFFRDPATDITEGRDSPEVRQAIIEFLRRPDQTIESRSESIRALALAGPQNPDVNAELLHLLDSPDGIVQTALLRNLPRLTLTPQDFASAKTRVTQLANDPAESADARKLANAILPCWTNNRHRGPCPALE